MKDRGLDRPPADRRIRRRLVGDLAIRENVLFLIIAVLLGIGVGLAILLLLG